MISFSRASQIPPYIFTLVHQYKKEAIQAGQEVIDFGIGNPDGEAPEHIKTELMNAVHQPEASRYHDPKGILPLREAICDWYQQRFQVTLNPETEALVTLGAKEGLAHLAMTLTGPNDVALIPDPAYPIHTHSFILVGATIKQIPLQTEQQFLQALTDMLPTLTPKPKVLLLNFPANPSTHCVSLDFFAAVVALARQYNFVIVHDFVYAELCFDDYQAPSLLQVKNAKEVAVETYSLSKSYNMAGWRVGFIAGNADIIAATARIKSYIDYGLFAPIQYAAIAALNSPPETVNEIKQIYQQRRDVLCDGLNAMDWIVDKPKASMFVWAKLPHAFQAMGSLEFTKQLVLHTGVLVSPGNGFGEMGEGYVRFSLVQSIEQTQLALERMTQYIQR